MMNFNNFPKLKFGKIPENKLHTFSGAFHSDVNSDVHRSDSDVCHFTNETIKEHNKQVAKYDAGKIRPSLVPVQIIKDIAEVREYGVRKYKDPENWKRVEFQRYVDAFYRHWIAFIEDPFSIDDESGIEHYKHAACNMAFICELIKELKIE